MIFWVDNFVLAIDVIHFEPAISWSIFHASSGRKYCRKSGKRELALQRSGGVKLVSVDVEPSAGEQHEFVWRLNQKKWPVLVSVLVCECD